MEAAFDRAQGRRMRCSARAMKARDRRQTNGLPDAGAKGPRGKMQSDDDVYGEQSYYSSLVRLKEDSLRDGY